MINSVPLSYYPIHIAFIMDGNRRWAKKRNLPLIDGHKKGAKVIEKILEKALEVDIKYLRNRPYRITLPDAPAPTSHVLEKIYYTNVHEIVTMINKLIN